MGVKGKHKMGRRKRKNKMRPPPAKYHGRRPHIRLANVEFTTEKITAKRLHATHTLSGNSIVGKKMTVRGRAKILGALHLRGRGDLIRSKVNKKTLRATVFVNKKNVKGCGIAVSNEGGFFDHNDQYITYEPLSGRKGLKINSKLTTMGTLYADGTLHLGGKGGARVSKVTGRTVHTLLHTNRHTTHGGGFAVSDAGGFFDFKDGYITYEPLKGEKGLNVNSKFSVVHGAQFKKDLSVSGDLNVKGNINVGGVKMMSFTKSFSGFHKKHEQLQNRVKELEDTNAALTQRMAKMEVMMQEMMSRQK